MSYWKIKIKHSFFKWWYLRIRDVTPNVVLFITYCNNLYSVYSLYSVKERISVETSFAFFINFKEREEHEIINTERTTIQWTFQCARETWAENCILVWPFYWFDDHQRVSTYFKCQLIRYIEYVLIGFLFVILPRWQFFCNVLIKLNYITFSNNVIRLDHKIYPASKVILHVKFFKFVRRNDSILEEKALDMLDQSLCCCFASA